MTNNSSTKSHRTTRQSKTVPLSKNALRQLWNDAADGKLRAEPFQRGDASPNLVIDGIPLLLAAAEAGHAAVVRALLSMPGIDPNLPVESGATALLLAVQNGHLGVVLALLAHPATDPNRATVMEGVTPLFLAAQNGHADVAEALLAHPEIQVDTLVEGIDAWTMADRLGHTGIADAILHRRADRTEPQAGAETPLLQ